MGENHSDIKISLTSKLTKMHHSIRASLAISIKTQQLTQDSRDHRSKRSYLEDD